MQEAYLQPFPLNQTAQFFELAEKISILFNQEGVRLRPFAKEKGKYFQLLDESGMTRVITQLTNDLEIYNSTLDGGYSLRNSAQLLWRALKKFNLSPLSDFFQELENDHIIEIYDSRGLQIFRNLNFFEVCSYSLEEVVCREWWHLYKRDETVTELIYKQSMKAFTQEVPCTYDPEIPPHLLVEIDSFEKNRMEYQILRVSPMLRDGKVVAITALERCNLI